MLNPCWPNPGYPVDKVIIVSKEEFDIPKTLLNGNRPFEDLYTIEHLKPEVREQVIQIKNRFCTWGENYSSTWEKYFLKFLKGYDFRNFTCFDFFGVTIGECDPELGLDESDVELMQNVYSRLQSTYLEAPENYSYEDPKDHETYLYLYQDKPFTVAQSKDEVQEAIERAKALNTPMSEEQKAAYMKRYGVE